MHPIVRFYVMRYNEGKTTIPPKWEEAVLEYINAEKNPETEEDGVKEQ